MASKVAVARALAEKHGTTYNRGHGPDIRNEKITINVESGRTLDTACLRLRGYRGPVYIAMTNDRDLDEAKAVTEGKTVGVMNSAGRIVRRSKRGRWP